MLWWLACLLVAVPGGCFVVEAPRARTRSLGSAPEWDSIMPEKDRVSKRNKEVRDKMKELREYKKQGRRYDGERFEKVAEAPKSEPPESSSSSSSSSPGGRSEEVRKKIDELKKLKSQGKTYDGKSLQDDDDGGVASVVDKYVGNEEEAGFSQLMDDAEAFFSDPPRKKKKTKTKKTTSGVGGTWSPPPTGDSDNLSEDFYYKPKVGTWGAFPRPRDISAAYGGGKKIGVGAYVNETEEALRDERTKAMLAKYREKKVDDQRLIDAHLEEIEGAIQFGKKSMLRGAPAEGVKRLESIRKYCTPKTEVGATALLELALCYEGSLRSDDARVIYGELETSPITDVKRRAKALSFGFEAQAKLNVGGFSGSAAETEVKKVYEMDWTNAKLQSGKWYSSGVSVQLSTSDKTLGGVQTSRSADYRVKDLDEAKDMLSLGCLGGDTFASPLRVKKSLQAYDDEAFNPSLLREDAAGSSSSSFESDEDDDDADLEEEVKGDDVVVLGKEASRNKAATTSTRNTTAERASDEARRDEETALQSLDGNWTVIFTVKDNDDGRYEREGVTVEFDAETRKVRRRLPLLGGLVYVDWDGSLDTDSLAKKKRGAFDRRHSNRFAVRRDQVAPGALASFVDARWHVEILHVDCKELCALKTNFNELILCKRDYSDFKNAQ